MSGNIQERWAFHTALHVEFKDVGKFIQDTRYTGVELNETQHNWLVGSVPGPNILDAWKVKAVMILYNIRNTQGDFGMIDKIGIRNGHLVLGSIENLNITRNANWDVKKLELPGPTSFRYSLGVMIHVNYPQIVDHGQWPTQFLFAGIGLEFVK
jgi:hypothetical protein